MKGEYDNGTKGKTTGGKANKVNPKGTKPAKSKEGKGKPPTKMW